MSLEVLRLELYQRPLSACAPSRPLPRVHLQWFAAEDEGRTEEPTEHKLRKAREEGKVAKSLEFTSSLVLLFAAAALGFLGIFMFKAALDMLRFFLVRSCELDVTRDGGIVLSFYGYFLRMAVPVAAVAFVAAIMGNLLQVGFLFTVKPITPDWTRIAPRFGRFFKRAFFSGEAMFNMAKSLLKILAVAAIAYLNIRAEVPRLLNLVEVPLARSFGLVVLLALRVIVESALAMLLLAIPDYLFQRRQHLEALKMSRQELKEERRMYEGDPLVRSRLRERMRELLTRTMIRKVPEADVVITNPTHFAVAVEWDRRAMEAPTVSAKGADLIAQKIKEIAREHNVPLVENKPLARALYDEVDVGEIIPERYYEVMAIILAEVYKMSGKIEKAV